MEEVLLKLKPIVENVACKKLSDQDLDASWEELDLDSLSLVELLQDVEDEFNLRLDYNIFSQHKITTVRTMAKYLASK
jgi:acyl carrier protein